MSLTEQMRCADEHYTRKHFARIQNPSDPAYDRLRNAIQLTPGDETPSLEDVHGAVPQVTRASEDDAGDRLAFDERVQPYDI